jgi:protocatechuate 3,4-dioxygenase beta subunit
MDIQLIDTNTCDPLPNIYMDLWHCNATVSHETSCDCAL